jgi:hypothetical protein
MPPAARALRIRVTGYPQFALWAIVMTARYAG